MTPIPDLPGHFVHHADRPRPLGLDGRIQVSYFIDLLSAVHDEANLNRLADQLADFIRGLGGHADAVAVVGPKAGNPLLVRETARRLELPSGFVRDSILFNRWVEGPCTPGDKVILVDDVSADGEMLCEAVGNLRKSGVYADKAFVLVDRTEGDAARLLKLMGVTLSSCHQLDDLAIDRLKETCGAEQRARAKS